MDLKSKKIYASVGSVFLLLAIFFLPSGGYPYDIELWAKWATYIKENGLSEVYHSKTDYLPVFHYILLFFSWFFDGEQSIHEHIHFIKIITYIFQLGTGYLLLDLLISESINKRIAWAATIIYLIHPGVIYNTFLWGQVDAIQTFFVFGMLYFAYKRKFPLSMIFCVLAVNFKLQAVIFLPILFLMGISALVKSERNQIGRSIVALAASQILIILPFIIGGTINQLLSVVVNSFGKYPFVSLNAFNFWELVSSDSPRHIKDTELWNGLTYHTWGLLLFFTISFLLLLPLIIRQVKAIRQGDVYFPPTKYWVILSAIVPVLFFYFNTQMHERYSHPMLLYVLIMAILYMDLKVFIVSIIAYILNLEMVLNYFNTADLWGKSIFFERYVIALMFALSIAWMLEMYVRPWLQPPSENKA